LATKFDSKEFARNRIFDLCAKYFPRDQLKINSGRKGFRLGDSTLALIDKSKVIIERVKESNETIPSSTANIFRYGLVCQEIFANLSSYQVISQLKSRSRRGYRKELELVDFDLRKVELKFKKSSEPSVKSQNDGKFIRNLQKSYLNMITADKYHSILNDVLQKQDLFVIENSDGKKFLDSLLKLVNAIIEKNEEKLDLQTDLKGNETHLKEIESQTKKYQEELPQIKTKVQFFRDQSGIPEILREKEELFSDTDLSLFLKIITTCLERYIKMMERRESRNIDQRDAFLGFIKEPTKFQGFDEKLWKEIVFIIEKHGFELISGKNWFKFENPIDLRQFVVQKEILEKFAHLRKLEISLDLTEKKLQNDPEYNNALKKIEDFNIKSGLIDNLRKNISDTKGKILSQSSDIETEKEKVYTLLR
jgi:hypothetical protein